MARADVVERLPRDLDGAQPARANRARDAACVAHVDRIGRHDQARPMKRRGMDRISAAAPNSVSASSATPISVLPVIAFR